MEQETQEVVVEETATGETEPQTNFDAKQIRKATEEKILRNLGTSSLDEAKKVLSEYNELKEAQKSAEEKLAEEQERVRQELAEQEKIANKLKKENELRSLGVREEQLNDAVNLTNGLSGEELQTKVATYFAKEPESTGTNSKADPVDPYAAIRERALNFKGKI